jgi:hypothetical protein
MPRRVLLLLLQKRFLFRPRPYMVARARGFSKDPTTSFPSRAVTCGTVYATLIGFSVINRNSDMDSLLQEFNWLLLLVVLAVTGSTAWARIYLGAHYPSDCIFSIPQSFLIMLVAISLFYFEKAICGSCFRIVEPLDHAEYAAPPKPNTASLRCSQLRIAAMCHHSTAQHSTAQHSCSSTAQHSILVAA